MLWPVKPSIWETYLLAQVLDIEHVSVRADAHERVLEARDVAVHEVNVESEHGIRRRSALVAERRRDITTLRMDLHSADGGVRLCDSEMPRR